MRMRRQMSLLSPDVVLPRDGQLRVWIDGGLAGSFHLPQPLEPALCVFLYHSAQLQSKHQKRRRNDQLYNHYVIHSSLFRQHFYPTPPVYRLEQGSSTAV